MKDLKWTDKEKQKAIHVKISTTNLAFLKWLRFRNKDTYSYNINLLLDMYRNEYFEKGSMTDADKESILNAEKFLNHTNPTKAEIDKNNFETSRNFEKEMTFFSLNKSLINPEKRELMKMLLDIYDDDAKKEKK